MWGLETLFFQILFECSFCTDFPIVVASQGHLGCVTPHCELYKFKIRTLPSAAGEFLNFPNCPNTGIQQGHKLKSGCVYIFRWIFDSCGRVTTLNRRSSLTVGKLFSPMIFQIKRGLSGEAFLAPPTPSIDNFCRDKNILMD